MSDKKRLPLTGVIYFTVLMPTSFLIILFEEMSLAAQIDSFLVPFTVAIFAGTGFYLGTKRR